MNDLRCRHNAESKVVDQHAGVRRTGHAEAQAVATLVERDPDLVQERATDLERLVAIINLLPAYARHARRFFNTE